MEPGHSRGLAAATFVAATFVAAGAFLADSSPLAGCIVVRHLLYVLPFSFWENALCEEGISADRQFVKYDGKTIYSERQVKWNT
jgi:hypothetical protein